MIVQEEDYVKHSGVKGMKWGNKQTPKYDPSNPENIRKSAEAANKLSSDASAMTPNIVNGVVQGYTDAEGHYFAGNQELATANKIKYDVSQTIDKDKQIVPDYSKYTVVQKGTFTSLTMFDKVKNISTDNINKGKSFMSNLFKPKEKKISYD